MILGLDDNVFRLPIHRRRQAHVSPIICYQGCVVSKRNKYNIVIDVFVRVEIMIHYRMLMNHYISDARQQRPLLPTVYEKSTPSVCCV